ncbi:MAG: nucleotidyltransferase substrate binding protein [Saprospiraceae bacterium]
MKQEDTRWKQRFQNFNNSMNYLKLALDIPQPTVVEKAGLIQFFEICFELSWNVLKDYLEEQGIMELKYPRESIKKAFETGLIRDGNIWLEALSDRNITSHLYDEPMADKAIAEIRNRYYPILFALHDHLKSQL